MLDHLWQLSVSWTIHLRINGAEMRNALSLVSGGRQLTLSFPFLPIFPMRLKKLDFYTVNAHFRLHRKTILLCEVMPNLLLLLLLPSTSMLRKALS